MVFDMGTMIAAFDRARHRCQCTDSSCKHPGNPESCNRTGDQNLEAHHIIPLYDNGPSTLENCMILCPACHDSVHGNDDWRKREV